MRAAVVVPYAEGGRVEIREVEAPAVAPGRVLVRVRASGLNRGEILLRRSAVKGAAMIGGVEFAGEVAAIGEGVASFKLGDRVMGHGRATQADYVLAESRALMPAPAHLSWAEAAAFPNVFTTAHDAVVSNGGLRAGENVLINAAASGIGTAAIQIAKAFGAKSIIGTSRSQDKLEKAKVFGLTHTAVTPGTSLVDVVRAATENRGADLVIDSVGGPALSETLKAMAVQGRLVNIGRMGGRIGELDMDRMSFQRLRLIGVSFRTRSNEETLACVEACARDLLPLLAARKLSVPVDRCFPLEQIAEAHDYVEKDSHVGKVVLTLD